ELVQFSLGDGPVLAGAEDLGPFRVLLGQFHAGFAVNDLGLVQIEGGLVRAGIDLEQKVSLLDLLPLAKMYRVQIGGYPGTDLHGVNRLDPAGEIFEIANRLHLGQTDVNLRLRGRSAEGICGRLRATGDEDRYKDHLSIAHVRSLDLLTPL